MARGLCERLFDHALERGWLKRGEVCLDPFGGVGTTGIVGASKGVQVVLVELEERFYKLTLENIELHRRTWEAFGDPIPIAIHGDSRKLVELVQGAACVVGSPPFCGSVAQSASPKAIFEKCEEKWGRSFKGSRAIAERDSYGTTPGQLGAMKPGSVDSVTTIECPYCHGDGKARIEGRDVGACLICDGKGSVPYSFLKPGSVDSVVSSPPYASCLKGDGTQQETAEESRAKRRTEGGSLGQSQRTSGYGGAGNLGNLAPGSVDAAIGSPPYCGNSGKSDRTGTERAERQADERGFRQGLGCFKTSEAYGDTPGQLGSLPSGTIDACVGSPPWEKSLQAHESDGVRNGARLGRTQHEDFGNTDGQLGNTIGPTFWEAAKTILEQVHAILKPGGVCLWVTKRYVRNGAIVDFSRDWLTLCEATGFEFVEWIRASLLKEDRHPGLFEGDVVKTKARKGFFRRLHERKRPDLAIDWEDVIVVRKPKEA